MLEALGQVLEWLQYHTSVMACMAEWADLRQRELYNVQVNINNSLVLLSRSVEKWMGIENVMRVVPKEGGSDEGVRINRGVGTEVEEVEGEEQARVQVQEELEIMEATMGAEMNTEEGAE